MPFVGVIIITVLCAQASAQRPAAYRFAAHHRRVPQRLWCPLMSDGVREAILEATDIHRSYGRGSSRFEALKGVSMRRA